ncbi:MAG: hypothetical protein KDB26_08445 [Microthrixaceae bacterium]|nr:hypothetical protein [Microthrixaceae bacterium]
MNLESELQAVSGSNVRTRRLRMLSIAIVLGMFLPLVAACVPQDNPGDPIPKANLLTNPGFEDGTNDPEAWSRDAYLTVSDLSWDYEVTCSGIRSVSIQSTVPNDARWIQTVTVEPNRLYELSGWIRTEDVQSSPEAVDAGANLSVMGALNSRSEALLGTNDWTFRRLRFNSGEATTVTIAARLGFFGGTTAGRAWFDDLRLAPIKPTNELPARWRMLVLIYDRTDFNYTDANGIQRHVKAQMTPQEVERARDTAVSFATEDIPALTSGSMIPTITVRTVPRALDTLSPQGVGWWPAPADTAAERDPSFDTVMVIWDPRTTDQATGESIWIADAAGLAPNMGFDQTYATVIAEGAVQYPHRNVFKHEFGHSILAYFNTLGATTLTSMANHAYPDEYVNCHTGLPYVWIDEQQDNPIPNSIYNNESGFTHDYYSGTVAKAEDPTRCLGITPEAWSYGGPVTGGW